MTDSLLYCGAVYRRAASKQLYLMRGVSGAGKSTVAQHLGAGGVVLSTDDFFMDRGQYRHNPSRIVQAHEWNQRRAADAMKRGISPIVIDNTMVKAWEGKPYVELALQYGYQVKIFEPDNSLWRRFQPGMSDEQLDVLAQEFGARNVHGVPPEAIGRMLRNWQHGIRVTDIMRSEVPGARKAEVLLHQGVLYRQASTSEQEVERLLLSVLPSSPFTGKVFAVGGYVRDEVMGLRSKDLDLVVELQGGAEKLAVYLHQQFPNETSTPYQIGKGYPIWHLVFKSDVQQGGQIYRTDGAELDFADSQKEAFPDPESRQRVTQFGTLQEDTLRRDFTVNMLLKDMTTGELVDPTGTSVQDIQQGILRLHPDVDPDQPFSDDPLRMLRLIRFMVKYGWGADPTTVEAVKRNAHRIEIVSGERVTGELTKMMQLGKLAPAIRFMADTGLLKYVMPEVEALRGVKQSPQHHSEGDVFDHTLLVLEKAAPTIEAQLAALLHDAGKPATQKFLADKIQFLGHEVVSGEIAEAMMRRLKFDLSAIKKVRRLVENHMRAHTSAEWGPGAVRKFIREIGDDLEDVLALTEIDSLSSLGPGMVSKHNPIPALRERIQQQREIPVSKKPILSGQDVMQALGIGSGKEVGVALRWLQDKADELAVAGEELTPEVAKRLLQTEFVRSAAVKLPSRYLLPSRYMMYGGSVYRLSAFHVAMSRTWQDAQLVVDYLVELGVNPVVIGGVAVQHHGYERQTADIDVLLSIEDYDTLVDMGKIENDRLVDLPGVDVLYDGDYWGSPDPEVVRKPGTNLPTFEGLILIKLKAGRVKDQADVVELLKRKQLDPMVKKRLDSFIQRHAPDLAEDLDGFWSVAEVEALRAKKPGK